MKTSRPILSLLTLLMVCFGVAHLSAALAPVDDFQAYEPGTVATATGGVWTAIGDGNLTEIQEQGDNRFISWGSGGSGASRDVTAHSVADGSTGTYFFRVRANTANPDNSFGLSDVAAPTTWGDFRIQVVIIQDSGSVRLGARNGESVTWYADNLEVGAWYNLWIVVDNDADTYDLYWSEAFEDGVSLASGVLYRNGATAGDLNRFMMIGNRDTLAISIDDIHFSSGEDTTNPIPEPVDVVFTEQPADAMAFVGGAVTFEAGAAGGSGTLAYQWQFSADGQNWADIDGAVSATHTIPVVAVTDGGLYRVVATSGEQTLASDPATLTVEFPVPTVTVAPEDVLLEAGDSHTFEVVATGLGNLTYTWRKDGVVLAETGATLTISNAQEADHGTYSVTVTDDAGVASGFGAMSTTLVAGLQTYDSAATVFLDGNDAFGSSSFNSDLNWDDGDAPSAGNDYIVEGPLAMRTPASGDSFTFAGDSLLLQGGGRLMYKGTGNTGVITIDNFILNGGSLEHQNGSGDFLQLQGNLAVHGNSAIWAKQGEINIQAPVSGAGTIFNQGSDSGPAAVVLSSPENTYSGNIINNGRFRLAETGRMNFVIQPEGASNRIEGSGPETTFNGVFAFDVSGAGTEVGTQWQVVAAANVVYGETFSVDGFTEYPGGAWVQGGFLFDEATGILESIDPSVPRFLTHPATIAAFVGEEIVLESFVLSEGEVTYQWQFSEDAGETWADISGATAASYAIAAAPYAAQGSYRVQATGGGETLNSNVAEVTLSFPPPTILQNITDVTVRQGDTFSFFVLAEGLGELTYEWRKDDVVLGETGNTLDLGAVEPGDAGTYSVTITDSAALDEGLAAVSVTLTAELSTVDAPPVGRALGLNFVGAASVNNPWGGSWVLGVLEPEEAAGILPIANWNSSATVNGVAVRAEPLFLEENNGEASGTSVTWSSANTWAVGPDGQPAESADGRLFHGYIETRASSALGQSTVTFSNIPYAQYDVYVYLAGGEGDIGRVWIDDENQTEFFFTSLPAGTFPRPYVQTSATTEAEAAANGPATVVRFSNVSESSLSIQHTEATTGHSGGIAAVAILDTTPEGSPYPPLVTSVPTDQFLPAGGTVELSVAAESQNAGGSLSYQWQKDGITIATGDTLTFNNISSADSGNYTVTVTDSSAPSLPRTAEATLVVADEAEPVLLSVDMQVGTDHAAMHGHAVLRESGPVTIDPNNPRDDIGLNGDEVADSLWNAPAAATGTASYDNFVDARGRSLAGLTLQVSGVTGVEDAPDRGGIDPFNIEDHSGPLLRDYAYVTDGDVMTVTVGGLQAFAGKEVTLVVYAIGKDSLSWPTSDNLSEHNDVSRVTLAGPNNYLSASPVDTSQDEGRDLRYNNEAFALFEAVVAGNGTITWTISEVPEEPGDNVLNAMNGFQLRFTDQGDHSTTTPVQDWRLTHFGTTENSGTAANTADFDGDGFSNLLEYALGTDPTLAGEGANAVTLDEASGQLSLTFDHIGDATLLYQIEATDDLAAGWSVVETYPAFTSAGTETYTDTEGAGLSQRFLRLRVTLQP